MEPPLFWDDSIIRVIMPPTIAIIICILCVVGMAVILAVDKYRGSLNVSMKTVGRGQYGTARWASSTEKLTRDYRINTSVVSAAKDWNEDLVEKRKTDDR